MTVIKPSASIKTTDLRKMRLAHGPRLRILRDPQDNIELEIYVREETIMAFLFRKFPIKNLHWKQLLVATQLCPAQDYPLNEDDVQRLVPVYSVTELPQRKFWKINSSFGEDFFWCTSHIRTEIISLSNTGSYLNLIGDNTGSLCYFSMEEPPDDNSVLEFALRLRDAMHIERQIRIESMLNHKKVCWYIPNMMQDRA